ncbi:MAG: GNAT family N-acetyltransferase [Nitrospiraceae bacterium]|nr:GNAT family N-acetyltransferase [Nitrospiraceae bacterium]
MKINSDHLLNILEPEGLVSAFMDHPPEGFGPLILEVDKKKVPGFSANLDLFTTAEPKVRRFFKKYADLLPASIQRLLKPRMIFIGTTVSEYALIPDGIEPQALKESAVVLLRESGLQFLIVKDIPSSSPLLSDEEKAFGGRLISYLRENGFYILYGQALAYLPINFDSTDEYLMRLSHARRKDIKRKLRSSSALSVERIKTGDDFFSDPNIDLLYGLYLNVYEMSEIHFDKLTKAFFKRVLLDEKNQGILFLYRAGEKIIGFNLCFIVKDCLVDKYVGFLYPDSRAFNLYFLSWFYNLEFCISNNLKTFVAGWTDPEIKAYLGAEFTYTFHAVYLKNPVLRFILGRFKSLFESDRSVLEAKGI